MRIYFAEEDVVTPEILGIMEKAAAQCVTREGLPEEACEVSVTFVSGEEIHQLNNQYRGVDRVTDVLSFPQYATAEEIREELSWRQDLKGGGDMVELGDVVICKDRAAEQAEEFGHSFEREIIYLFVHSILHLLGYDHMEEEEKAEMRQREEEIMEYLGIQR